MKTTPNDADDRARERVEYIRNILFMAPYDALWKTR